MDDQEEEQTPILKFWQLWKVPIFIGIFSLFLIITSIILLVKSSQSSVPIEFSSEKVSSQATESAKKISLISIDVEGAVVNPGLYQLPTGSRVEEAIAAAGGLSDEADEQKISQTINRASKLVDGGKIYIPKIGSLDDRTMGRSEEVGKISGLETININTATLNQLDTLSGVGPVTAQKIIDNRPYQTLEELVSKKAMGQALYEKLKDKLTL